METSAKITKSLRIEDVKRAWYIVDAEGKTLGRLATQVALVLRGKLKANFTPHVDGGDFVIVVNAEKAVLKGKRPDQKVYYHNTMYPGGDRYRSYKDMRTMRPEYVIEHAVRCMLPKTKLGDAMFKKLKVYAGPEHKNAAQKPVPYELPY